MSTPTKIGSVELREWQAEAVPLLLLALSKHGAAVDASDLGTGKSYSGAFVAALASDNKLIAVVCPKAVAPSWRSIFALMGLPDSAFRVVNYERLRGKKGVPELGGWDTTGKRFVWNAGVGFVVFDEAHQVRSPDGTLNSRMAIGAKLSKVPHLYLSATMAGSPAHFRAVGFALGLHDGAGFQKWCIAHGCTYDPWGKLILKRTQAKEVTARLNEMLFPEYGVRIRKADIPGFPENEILAEAFDFGDNASIAKAYEEMAEELAALEAKEERDQHKVKEQAKAMVAQLRARQKVELLKVPGVAGMVDDAIDEGQAVVVFTNFDATLDRLLELCKSHQPVVVRGGQNEGVRQQAIDHFQTGHTHLIFVNIQSGGAGISLHDVNGTRPRLALIFPTYSAVNLRQATGRIHRAGSKSKATQRILFAAGTVEEKVLRRMQRKLDDLDRLNDGDLLGGADEDSLVLVDAAPKECPITGKPEGEEPFSPYL